MADKWNEEYMKKVERGQINSGSGRQALLDLILEMASNYGSDDDEIPKSEVARLICTYFAEIGLINEGCDPDEVGVVLKFFGKKSAGALAPIDQFFLECVQSVDNYVAGSGIGEVDGAKLYKAYEAWCEGAGETPKSKTAFGRWCSDLGFVKVVVNGRIFRGGCKLIYFSDSAWWRGYFSKNGDD